MDSLFSREDLPFRITQISFHGNWRRSYSDSVTVYLGSWDGHYQLNFQYVGDRDVVADNNYIAASKRLSNGFYLFIEDIYDRNDPHFSKYYNEYWRDLKEDPEHNW